MPDRYSKVEDPFSAIESLGKALLFCSAVCYVGGLLVTNLYLRRYGFSDFSLLRTRFVFIGAISLLPLLIMSVVFWLIGKTVADENNRNQLNEFRGMIDSISLIIRIFITMSKTLFIITVGCTMILFFTEVSDMGYDVFATIFSENLDLMSWFSLPIAVIFFLLGFRDNLQFDNDAGSMTGIPHMLVSRTRGNSVVIVLVVPSLIIATLLYMSIFANYFYPNMSEQFGGAETKTVQLVLFDDALDEAIDAGIDMEGDSQRSVPMPLLWEGERVFLVAFPDPVYPGRSVQLDKSMVAAVLTVP